METQNKERVSPAENVVRKACIWHASLIAETQAAFGHITKAVKWRERCARDLAEAVEKYNKSSR